MYCWRFFTDNVYQTTVYNQNLPHCTYKVVISIYIYNKTKSFCNISKEAQIGCKTKKILLKKAEQLTYYQFDMIRIICFACSYQNRMTNIFCKQINYNCDSIYEIKLAH